MAILLVEVSHKNLIFQGKHRQTIRLLFADLFWYSISLVMSNNCYVLNDLFFEFLISFQTCVLAGSFMLLVT